MRTQWSGNRTATRDTQGRSGIVSDGRLGVTSFREDRRDVIGQPVISEYPGNTVPHDPNTTCRKRRSRKLLSLTFSDPIPLITIPGHSYYYATNNISHFESSYETENILMQTTFVERRNCVIDTSDSIVFCFARRSLKYNHRIFHWNEYYTYNWWFT